MIESWKVQLNNVTKVGAIITDLSKAFDSLNHNALLTKLKTYGLGNNPVEFFRSYKRYQRCKISNSFSHWKRVLAGFPKALFCDLYFLAFINDIFLFLTLQITLMIVLCTHLIKMCIAL